MANQHTKAKDDKQRLEDELLEVSRKRFRAARDAESDMRTEFTIDMKFRAGDQWPDAIKSIRDSQKKPCLTVNRLQQFEKQVTNQMRQAMPAINVSPGDNAADEDTAEVIQGLVRHIEYDSNAAVAYERGGTSAVRGGIGFWRVLPDYEDENTFNQVLRIKSIRDAMMVSIDPASSEPDGSDMRWGYIYEDLPKEEFEAAYPDASSSSAEGLEALNSSAPDWLNGQQIRVAEYYWIETKAGWLYETEDGRVTDKEPEKFKRKRATKLPQLRWMKQTGVEILEGPLDLPGKYVPIIPCYGDEIVVDGKVIHEGIVRNARDSVRMSNYWASAEAQAIALGPKAPYIGAEGQFEGHEAEWAQANNEDRAYLTYKPKTVEGNLVGPPQRNVVEPAIQAISHARMMCIEDLKAITGIFDPSLGNRDSAQSGIAIRSLQSQGNNANFHFVDNQHRSICHTGRIIVDLAPYYYDTKRVIQIVGDDGDTKTVTINGPSGMMGEDGNEKTYDLTQGKYHVVLSAGASYQTKRQEEAAFLEKVLQAYPDLMKVAGDLVFRARDDSGAEALADRLKKALPPQLQDEDPNKPQAQIPPAVQQQMQQEAQMNQMLVKALHEAKDQLEAAKSGEATKLEIAKMQEETKRMVALLQSGSKAAAVELQHSLAVLENDAARTHELTLAVMPPAQAPQAAGPEPQSLIPSTQSPSGSPAGGPQVDPMSAGANAGQE